MTTDFSYGGKQSVIGGPIKPGGKDMPGDARTRVDCYADIASIPNPYVGLKITVKVDETNNNKMTDYIVKSLKANSIGLANSLIDEVVRYVDYLGVTTGGGTGGGLTSDQLVTLNKVPTIEQDVANLKTTVGDNSSGLVKDVEDLKTNGVSQDNINKAVENYLSKNPISGGVTLRNVNDGEIFILKGQTINNYGDMVLSTTSLSIDENTTKTFTVKLGSAPTNNQTVNISVNNAYSTIDKTSLIFTSTNYNTEQTVTVTGVHLDTDYSNKNSIITLSSSNVSSKTINVTITNIDIEPILDNITAVYTQGNTKIYPDTSLDSLKSNLIVTVNYTDGSNSQVTNYILEGTLTEGTSTITVTYNEKSTTFNVTVIARPVLSSITAVYTQGGMVIHPSTSLDSLKSNLVVTANYTDSTSETITDYVLSGTLTEGTSTITVTYNEKSTTFDVNVSKEPVNTDSRVATFLFKDMINNTTCEYDNNNSTNVVTIKNLGNSGIDWVHPCVTSANKVQGADAVSSIVNADGLIFADGRSFGQIEISDNSAMRSTKQIEIIFKPIQDTKVSISDNGSKSTLFGVQASGGWNFNPPKITFSDTLTTISLNCRYSNSSLEIEKDKWNILTYCWDGTADSTTVIPNPGAHLYLNGQEIALTDCYGSIKIDVGSFILGNPNYCIKEIGFYETYEDSSTVLARHSQYQ